MKERVVFIIKKITGFGFLTVIVIMAIIRAVIMAALFFKNRFLVKMNCFIKDDRTSVWLV